MGFQLVKIYFFTSIQKIFIFPCGLTPHPHSYGSQSSPTTAPSPVGEGQGEVQPVRDRTLFAPRASLSECKSAGSPASWIIRASITFQCQQILTDFSRYFHVKCSYGLARLRSRRPTENPLHPFKLRPKGVRSGSVFSLSFRTFLSILIRNKRERKVHIIKKLLG